MVRYGSNGAWRAPQPPRPTKAQRAILALLIQGDNTLSIYDDGVVWLNNTRIKVNPRVYQALLENEWIDPPLPELPLYGEPAREGGVTELGRQAFIRSTRA
jgi:hypothetical protein